MPPRIKFLLPLFCLVLMPLAWGHSGGHDHHFTPQKLDPAQGLSAVTLPPNAQQTIGLDTREITRKVMHRVIEVPGQVVAAEDRYFDLTAPLPGRVRRILARQGDAVRAGQLLAVIESTEAISALKHLVQEKNRLTKEIRVQQTELDYLEKVARREQRLLDEGISSRQEAQRALADAENARATLEALKQEKALLTRSLREQQQVLGQSGDSPEPRIRIFAPVDGVITRRDLSSGETVDPGKVLFQVAQLQPIWIELNVYQDDIPRIREGQPVFIRHNQQEIEARVSAITRALDPDTRTVAVRVESPNEQGLLLPGMYVSAAIHTEESRKDVLAVPESALIEHEGRYLAFVREDRNRFVPVALSLGMRSANEAEVRSGLNPGAEVVTQGVRQLWAQSMMQESEDAAARLDDENHRLQLQEPEILPFFLGGLLLGLLVAGLLVWLLNRRSPSDD